MSAVEAATVLRQHLAVGQEMLTLVENEHRALRSVEPFDRTAFATARRSFLERLKRSVEDLRLQRVAWSQMTPADRARYPEVPVLIQRNQELWMKALVLDRENEQLLLRRGLLPAAHLPSANRQRPHFVADLYRRIGAT